VVWRTNGVLGPGKFGALLKAQTASSTIIL
jgi:hypothetical protein